MAGGAGAGRAVNVGAQITEFIPSNIHVSGSVEAAYGGFAELDAGIIRLAGQEFGGDTGWIDLPAPSGGWVVPSGEQGPQARMRNDIVVFRGVLSSATFTGGFTTISSLPPEIPPPDSNLGAGAIVSQNSTALVRARILGDG